LTPRMIALNVSREMLTVLITAYPNKYDKREKFIPLICVCVCVCQILNIIKRNATQV